MMGQPVEQAALFYEFRLDERVPEGHLLRRVDAILDLSFVREHMAPHYSAIGRPSVCPELMVRMLLVGYLYGLRSERRLCEEVDLNLAYRWFCRLGLEGRVPDHSTFTKARHGRFRDSSLLREVFERLIEQCLRAGLASVEHVAVDGSHVLASADPHRRVAHAEELPREGASRAVREYWEGLYDAACDRYICPQGARLAATKGDGSTVPYVSSVKDCRPCPIRAGCTSGLRRKVNRSRYEDVRQEVLAREATPAFQASLRLRRRIERLFACIKHNDGLHRLRLRGLRGAGEQFLLAATARNLKSMAMALTRAEPMSG